MSFLSRPGGVQVINHSPPGYQCPFCLLVRGVENEHVESVSSDIVFRDERVTAFMASRQWPGNRGHVLVIPNAHHENIYDLPDDLGAAIHRVSKAIARAMKKAYRCAGISTRQHNEPAGDQDVWHYHLHVFPRYENDGLYTSSRLPMNAAERAVYADRLRAEIRKP